MERLNSLQLDQLARSFTGIANSLSNYREENWSKLKSQEKKDFHRYINTLFDTARELSAQAVIVRFEEVSDNIKNLKSVTAEIKKTIIRVKNIQKVIELASSAALLAVSISTGNPVGIGASISGILSNILQMADEDAE